MLAYTDTWSCTTLTSKSDSTARENLITWLQASYTGTILKWKWEIGRVLNLEANEIANYAASFVNNNLGGDIEIEVNLEIVDNSKTVADCATTIWEVIYWTANWLAWNLTCDDDIFICNWTPWNWYTISACNAWALVVYTGIGQSFVAETTVRSSWVNEWAGWFYQWWNSADLSLSSATSTHIVSTILIDSNYNVDTNFINWNSSYRKDWIQVKEDNLWWNTTSTDEARKGPCDEWYHIPTKSEWQNLINLKWEPSNLWTEMSDELKLPIAGGAFWSTGIPYIQWNTGTYWTSTPNWDNANFMYFSANAIYTNDYQFRTFGASIRCFQN